jgi:hypothetical protein
MWFIGYFLHKRSADPKWVFTKDGRVSDYFDIPKLSRADKYEIYQRGDDKNVIWSVGGKNQIEKAFSDIVTINKIAPGDRFENIVIVTDRDNDDIPDILAQFNLTLEAQNIKVNLRNGAINSVEYEIENERLSMSICPIIIPFDNVGALETVIMSAISGESVENEFIVGRAKNYIADIHTSEIVINYLRHAHERLKAEFSAVISVLNPDKSTMRFNDMFINHNWENSEYITNQFGLLLELFC